MNYSELKPLRGEDETDCARRVYNLLKCEFLADALEGKTAADEKPFTSLSADERQELKTKNPALYFETMKRELNDKK